jgi:hypothetical protein
MDFGVIAVVVVLVLLLLVASGVGAARAHKRKLAEQRTQAARNRAEAQIRAASADQREAESAERAARARREEAQAREQAARAREDREAAQERLAAADRVDPDVRGGDADDGAGRSAMHHEDPAGRTDLVGVGSSEEARAAGDPAGRTDRINLDDRTPAGADPAARTDRMNLDDSSAGQQGAEPSRANAPMSGTGVRAGITGGTDRRGRAPGADALGRDERGGDDGTRHTADTGRSVVGGTEPGQADVSVTGRRGEALSTGDAAVSLPEQRVGRHEQPVVTDRRTGTPDGGGQCDPPRSGEQVDLAQGHARDSDRSPVRAFADRLLGRAR